MKILVIEASNYLKMPWANGSGITREVDIWPPGSSLANRDFLWRVSSASVIGKGSFSEFSGFDRLLTVISPNNLIVNSHSLSLGQVLQFPGEQEMTYLAQSEVTDFGIIYDRNRCVAKMTFFDFQQSMSSLFNLTVGTHYFYLITGCLKLKSHQITKGSTMRIQVDRTDQEVHADIVTDENTKFIFASLSTK